MKRFCALFTLFCMIFFLGTIQVNAESNTEKKENIQVLSSFSDEDCREFLLKYGIEIPEELSGIDLQELFARFEENPDVEIVVGWSVLAKFSEQVRYAVRDYYGIEEVQTDRASSYILQQSDVFSWNALFMEGYNCYAYALGRSS